MSGFEPGTSGVGSDRSTKSAVTMDGTLFVMDGIMWHDAIYVEDEDVASIPTIVMKT